MKNGGPYTRKQRDERRNEVFKLHFEQGKSAVEISKIKEVSRNTINDDIQFWNEQLGEDYLKYDYNCWIAKQFSRLESQRGRLLDQLEKEDSTKDVFAVEDRLYRLDVKILELTEKILHGKRKTVTINDVDEELVKRVTRFILIENSSADSTIFSEEEIEKHSLSLLKCTERKSMLIFFKMQDLGLKLYKIRRQFDVLYPVDEYDLWDFAKARSYISEKEFDKKRRKNT